MSEEDKLSPDASPSLMEMKTGKARRINNRPVLITVIPPYKFSAPVAQATGALLFYPCLLTTLVP